MSLMAENRLLIGRHCEPDGLVIDPHCGPDDEEWGCYRSSL